MKTPTTFKAAIKNKKLGPILARYIAYYAGKYADFGTTAPAAAVYATQDAWNRYKRWGTIEAVAAVMIDELEYFGA